MPRKQKKYHFIYKTTNLLSGKYYLGMHSTHDLNDGYMGSGKRLCYSINKHGKENHKREILEFCESREELKEREEEIVNLNEIAKKECMNLRVGGYGGFSVEQQKINGANANIKMEGLRKNDPEWVKKRAIKSSMSMKLAYKEGRHTVIPPNWTGKKHTKQSIQKQKNTFKKIKHQQGSKNSQYETRLITDGIKTTRIKKNEFIPIGWRLGATYKNRAPKKFKSIWINNGVKTKMIKKDISIPIGWRLGRKL